MLDNQWIQYKNMMRYKYKGNKKNLAELEAAINMFETASGKLDLGRLTQFAKDKGSRMPRAQKEAIVSDTQAEMTKQGVKDGTTH